MTFSAATAIDSARKAKESDKDYTARMVLAVVREVRRVAYGGDVRRLPDQPESTTTGHIPEDLRDCVYKRSA